MEKGYILYKIEDLKAGDHLCCLYETEEEHKALITPFLRKGLENNEKIVYIVDKHTSKTVLDYLREDGIVVEPYLERGQLVILTVSESYMKEGVFDPDGMINLLKNETDKALDEGYNALRVTGEMTWALRGLLGSERLIEYESKLNEFFPTSKCLAICQYDMRHFDPEILLNILETHPIVVIGTKIYDNFYYIPTDEFLGGKIPETTLNHWTENLKLRKQVEEELQKSEKKYRDLVDNAPVGVYQTTVDGNIIFVNESLVNMFGFESREEMMKVKSPSRYKNSKDREFITQKLMKKGGLKDHEVEMLKKSGESINVILSANIDDGIISGVLVNITERKKAEEALKKSETKYRAIFENVQDVFYQTDNEGNIIEISPSIERYSGFTREELIGKPVEMVYVDPEDRKDLLKAIHERGEVVDYEVRLKTKNNSLIYVSTNAHILFDSNNQLIGIEGSLRDITERTKMEEEIKKSLEEKEMLLKEIHHRVKNNLMVISSLLNLQSRYIKDKEALSIFKESQSRAKSMALIHEKLYSSTDLKRIDFGDYIRTLSSDLFQTYVADPSRIKMNINVENIMLDINTAIPLGLIVNELVSNSMKHAFPNGRNGELNIDFHTKDDNLVLMVSDDGVGFPEDLDYKNTDSLGLQLVNSLTGQIDGNIELDRSKGTAFKITFTEEEYK